MADSVPSLRKSVVCSLWAGLIVATGQAAGAGFYAAPQPNAHANSNVNGGVQATPGFAGPSFFGPVAGTGSTQPFPTAGMGMSSAHGLSHQPVLDYGIASYPGYSGSVTGQSEAQLGGPHRAQLPRESGVIGAENRDPGAADSPAGTVFPQQHFGGEYADPHDQDAMNRRDPGRPVNAARRPKRKRRDTDSESNPVIADLTERLRRLRLTENPPLPDIKGVKTMLAAAALYGLQLVGLPLALFAFGVGGMRYLKSKDERDRSLLERSNYRKNKQGSN
ncbi:hypothetical protein TGARI_319630 [Toxoplasma gondii ARI]|uniref:Transmembrane protein n=1 Tax=Toxoplasma gondii ARI TaxID=1074872 RepID=A0A139XJZ1_TOXGO|nr:hypothetical protein TGARI_319630 [Toxoplasma gondii ARI]